MERTVDFQRPSHLSYSSILHHERSILHRSHLLQDTAHCAREHPLAQIAREVVNDIRVIYGYLARPEMMEILHTMAPYRDVVCVSMCGIIDSNFCNIRMNFKSKFFNVSVCDVHCVSHNFEFFFPLKIVIYNWIKLSFRTKKKCVEGRGITASNHFQYFNSHCGWCPEGREEVRGAAWSNSDAWNALELPESGDWPALQPAEHCHCENISGFLRKCTAEEPPWRS